MGTNIKTIQISFNLNDPFQEKLYKHAKKNRNISFYGKSLIMRDMEGSWAYVNAIQEAQEECEISKDILKGFI